MDPPPTTNRALARAGLIVSGAFLASRVLGFVRAIVIINTFSAGQELDAFFAAFRLPDLIFQLVAAGALSSALIPVVSGLLGRGEEARAWRVVSTVTNMMLIAMIVLATILFAFAPAIVPVLTPGFNPENWDRTIELTRIMLLSPIFLALGSVATSVLNARGRFAASAVAPIVYNLAIIGGALLLAPSLGVTGLAISVVAGSLGHLLVQLPSVAAIGYRHLPSINLGDPPSRQALKLMGPRALGLGAGQITFIVVTSIATTFGPGALTVFNTAFTLLQIPIGVIGVPLGIVVLPSLSREAAAGRHEEFAALVSRAIRLLLFVMLPITGIAIVLRREIVALLFGYGRFDDATIDLTAATLLAFLVGLAAHALIAVLARAFYARQDTATPVVAALLAVVVNSTLAGLLAGPFGLPGVALAIAIAAWLETAVLLVALKRRLPELAVRPIAVLAVRSAVVTVGGSAVAALVAAGLAAIVGPDESRLVLLGRMIAAGIAWLVTSAALAGVLRIGELTSIIGLMADLVRRPRHA